MRLIQTQTTFPLSSVKPLERVAEYRQRCLEATRKACAAGVRRRERSPVTGRALEEAGTVEGLSYSRCPDTGSLFLTHLPGKKEWGELLREVSRFRRSPEAFHLDLAQSRVENVYRPKLEWIQETLRIQGLARPRLVELVTPPGDLSQFLRESGSFSQVLTADETDLAQGGASAPTWGEVHAALLFESLDRAADPEALLGGVAERLAKGGFLFVTGLVASGFDLAVLGLKNLYLYPPDRTNCFTLEGLKQMLGRFGFSLVEVSTPGVLDVQIVEEHRRRMPELAFSPLERQILSASAEARSAFQSFLQEWGLSSFARIVARKKE